MVHHAASPAPCWILRQHAPNAIHSTAFVNSGSYLICGDASGYVSVSSMLDYRPLIMWKAHDDAILRADAWNGYLVTHGRDNCVQVWMMTDTIPTWGGELDPPQHILRVDVNALNYCAYDLATTTSNRLEGYLAVPNTLESAYIDIYALHDKKRIAEAVGHAGVLGRGLERPPIVMCLCLTLRRDLMWLVAGYEDGSIQAWTMLISDAELKPELRWSLRPHKESTMALTLTPDHDAVVSVGADQRLVQIALDFDPAVDTFHLPRPGNASVAVRADQQIFAIGGWDGGVRIVSKTKKLLATLVYHKQGIGSVAFVRRNLCNTLKIAEMDSDEEDSKVVPEHLLAVGAKDGRVSLWDTPFTVADVTPALRAP